MIAAMIKSAVVLAVAACVASLLKRQSAAVRHTVWTAGLIGAMAIPLFTLTLPSWQTSFAGPVLALIQESLGAPALLAPFAITLWIAGATAGLLLLLYSAGRLAWVAIGSEPVEDARWAALAEGVRQRLGIRRRVRLLQNRSVPFLGTWGIVAPRVLLPRDAERWPDDRIRMVLAHELSHIQRHDWVVQVLADAARAIYWFNPIFWLASSRLRRESEHACDDAVVRLGAAGTAYAEELLAMTRALRSEERLQSPILAMAEPSHLELRLVALLNPSLNRLAATPWAVIVVAGVAIALTLPLAAVRPEAEPLTVVMQSAPLLAASPAQAFLETEPAEPSPADTNIKAVVRAQPPGDESPAPLSAPLATFAAPSATAASPPDSNLTAAPPFECRETASRVQTKVSSIQKEALGSGPWIINSERTIWAPDQPYIANRAVNTIWMRPANTELMLTARRLDGDAPDFTAGPATPYETAYVAISVNFPVAGCWEVTATAGESKLTFTTRVRE
jgi:beta-lactamase regulating signal transducer with metallopeptidase domain